MGPRPHLSFCALQNSVTLAPELLVSMGPTPHLWYFVHSKQRLISIGITSLYGSHTSTVVLASLHLWFLYAKQQLIWIRITSLSMGPRPHLWFFAF